MTEFETQLWQHLRDRRFFKVKFRRQVPIQKYIADFVCFEKRIIIELDGSEHNEDNQKEYDKKRDEFFKSQGYVVLRFWNNDLSNNFEGVLSKIYNTINTPHPPFRHPLPHRGEG